MNKYIIGIVSVISSLFTIWLIQFVDMNKDKFALPFILGFSILYYASFSWGFEK